jgi:DNA-binding transcriptional MerR regulator
MTKTSKDKGIAQAARAVPCAEGTMRRLDRLGVVHPIRDPWGRRLFGDDDVLAARAHLARPAQIAAA